MKQTVAGKFYSWFNDETWEQALENHNIDGFNSIHWAICESLDSENSKFKIVDHERNVVFDSSQYDKETLDLMALCNPDKFYVKFQDENLREAILNHSTGYSSLEDALIDVAINSGVSGEKFEVYNWKIELVHSSIVK